MGILLPLSELIRYKIFYGTEGKSHFTIIVGFYMQSKSLYTINLISKIPVNYILRKITLTNIFNSFVFMKYTYISILYSQMFAAICTVMFMFYRTLVLIENILK